MAKAKSVKRQLQKKHSTARTGLAKGLKDVRRWDRGHGTLPYYQARSLHGLEFATGLKIALQTKISAGRRKINVLEKGAGTGKTAAEVKQIDPNRIAITALTASKTISVEYKKIIDFVRITSGLRARHTAKYDIIYDHFAEDYHLPRELVGPSILKSTSLLKKGGELFTIIPLVQGKNEYCLSIAEGRRLLSEISLRKDVKVRCKEKKKRFERREYVDMHIHITKR